MQVIKLKENIEAARVHLLAHPVYSQINNLEGLQNLPNIMFLQFGIL